MSRFMILGSEEFTLGFRLAGIKDIIDVNESNSEKEIIKILTEKVEGILVLDKITMDHISERTRNKLEDSVNPVAVVLAESNDQDNLRRLIMKAIGVDILK